MEKKDKDTVVTPAMQALATATGNAAVVVPKKTRTVDHEMAALKKCREILGALDAAVRNRILGYLADEARQAAYKGEVNKGLRDYPDAAQATGPILGYMR